MKERECLFNREAYHRCNMSGAQQYLRLEYRQDDRTIATLAGVLDDGCLDSGFSAPYGGIDFIAEFEFPSVISSTIRALLSAARDAGARRVRIRCRPAYVSGMEAAIQFALLGQGFTVESCELAQGMRVGELDGMQDYATRLRSSARRVLRHSMGMGLQWSQAESANDWSAAYEVLRLNRSQRGVTLKYSDDYVQNMRRLFPGRLRMGVVRHEDRMIAAALVYRVLPRIDYVAAWGDAGHSLPYSPMNWLAYHVIEDCRQLGGEIVDLGVSSRDGVADDGLVNFKRHILAEPALRLDLVRDL